MSIWVGILIGCLVSIVFGLKIFFKNLITFKNRKSSLLIGIFLPVFIAYSYQETVTSDFAPAFTVIDVGGLLILGILSGIFIASYFLVDRI